MKHRHLNHQEFTLAAIDNLISRGKRKDWAELHQAALNDSLVLEKGLQICQARTADPDAQRYHFGEQNAQRNLA